jgi:hypothetical protein
MTTFEIFMFLFGFCTGSAFLWFGTYYYCLLSGKMDSFRKIFWS